MIGLLKSISRYRSPSEWIIKYIIYILMFKNLETVSRTGIQRAPLKDWPSKLLHNKYKILEGVGEGKYGYLMFIYT